MNYLEIKGFDAGGNLPLGNTENPMLKENWVEYLIRDNILCTLLVITIN